MTPRSIALRGAAEGVSGYCFENLLVEHISLRLSYQILTDADDDRNIYELDTKELRDFALAKFPEKLKPHVTQEEQEDLVQKEMLQAIQYFGNRYWQPPVITGTPADIDNFRAFFDTSLQNQNKNGTPRLSRGGPAYWWELTPNRAMSWGDAKTLQACRLKPYHYKKLELMLASETSLDRYNLPRLFGQDYFDTLSDRLGGTKEARYAILLHIFHALKRRGINAKAKKIVYTYESGTYGKLNENPTYTDDLSEIDSLEVTL